MDMRLEVVVLPVSDVDRARAFYETLGWRVDAAVATDDLRAARMTPPGSACSIVFGIDLTGAAPGSVQGLTLAVADLEAARADLRARGADVSEIFHDAGGVFRRAGAEFRVPGLDPRRRSRASYASFADPDGNGWVLQEITTSPHGR
ncbi:glyoxalase [Agromyces protaetiae]|uniref:Glyoxalase n=1 Tax=Agromyces protaetiae TaxID=2509455 RepID=A0A4V0YH62_9MICO|nr:VOC family protein [Agromyces protaetiae]QAY73601.1 glyoxalase [Agromyces protaetiae]